MRIILIVTAIVISLFVAGCGGGTPTTKLATTKAPAIGAFDSRGGYVPPTGYTESAIFAVSATSSACNPIQNTDSTGKVTWTVPPTSLSLNVNYAASNASSSDGRSLKRGGPIPTMWQYWFSGSNTAAVSADGNVNFNLVGTYHVSGTFFSPETSNGLWVEANVIVVSQSDWNSMTKFDAVIMGYTPYSYTSSGTNVPAKFTSLDTEADGTVKAKVGQQLAAKGLIVPLNRGGGDMTTSTIEDVQVTVLNDLGLPTNGQWELGADYSSPYALFTVKSIGYYKVEIRVVSNSGNKVTTITKRLHIEAAPVSGTTQTTLFDITVGDMAQITPDGTRHFTVNGNHEFRTGFGTSWYHIKTETSCPGELNALQYESNGRFKCVANGTGTFVTKVTNLDTNETVTETVTIEVIGMPIDQGGLGEVR
ncbi:MAG: hypothetical protein WCI57_04610 [Candidatus Berkelbacteria bacterium]